MLNYHELSKKLEYLDHQIARCRQQLEKMPPGRLIVAKNGGHAKWYLNSNDHSGNPSPASTCASSDTTCLHSGSSRYLPKTTKENQLLAETLAFKRYLECVLKEALAQKEVLEDCLRKLQKISRESDRILTNPEYQKLLKVSFTPENDALKEWASAEYASNPSHPDGLRIQSPTGHSLRSKSEVFIDMALSQHKIPFRYESPLTINGTVYYPDFTIRHPKTGEFYYWEHFGLVDQYDYRNNCVEKLRTYMKAGIFPTINLIMTCETNERPLSPQTVEQQIELFLS